MKYLVTLISLFGFFSSYSQTDFRRAYLVTQAGDTVNGFASYKYNPAYCSFKDSQDNEAVRILPDSIRAYGFPNDKLFISGNMPEDNSPRLLEVIVYGELSLFKDPETFYAQKGDSSLVALKNDKKEVRYNSQVMVMDSKEYIGMLNILMSGCDEVKSGLQQLKYTQRALTEAVDKYNRCRGEASTIIRESTPWKTIYFGFSGGLNHARLTINKTSGIHSNIGEIDPNSSFILGTHIYLINERLNPKIGFYVGLFYTQSTFKKPFNEGNRENYFEASLSTLKIPLGVGYELFRISKVKVNLSAGMANHIQLKNKNSLFVTYWNGNEYVYEEFDGYRSPSGISIGLWAGTTISHEISNDRTLFLDARYERTNGVSDIADFKDNLSALQVTAGLQFKL